jgi:hypothetical protein
MIFPSAMRTVGYWEPSPPEYPGHSPYHGSSIMGSRQAYGRPPLSTAMVASWITIKKKIATITIKRAFEWQLFGTYEGLYVHTPNNTHEKASMTLIWLQYSYEETIEKTPSAELISVPSFTNKSQKRGGRKPHSLVLESFFVCVRPSPHEPQSELGLMKSLLSLQTTRERHAIAEGSSKSPYTVQAPIARWMVKGVS